MVSTHLRTPTLSYYTTFYDKSFKSKIIKMATGIHFGFMQIKKIAQGCRLGI